MAKQVSLSVNDVPIQLDYFVEEYIDHVIGGILASLKDTGEIENMELLIDDGGEVSISLNNNEIPLKYFPNEIIKSTVMGMVSPLKGVKEVNKLKIKIGR